MRILLLYDYPYNAGSFSVQGDTLYRGMLENGEKCVACNLHDDREKERLYRDFRPDVAIGVGWWGETPQLVLHPLKFGVRPVPWLVADGWVANYHDILGSLPLTLATSQWVREVYIRDGVRGDNIEVIPEGCHTDEFRPLSSEDPHVRMIRRRLGVASDEKMILTIGGDAASKGSREVMRALAKIDGEYSKWKYVCKVWDAPRTQEQNQKDWQLAVELGIDHKVVFLTGVFPREIMPFLTNACDVYAAPSRQEGFGRPLVEAQACGKPVVSVAGTATKEVVLHNDTGFLAGVARRIERSEDWVHPSMGFACTQKVVFDKPKTIAVRADVDDLACYLLRLLGDDRLRQEMGQRARAHAVRRFHYRSVAKEMVKLVAQKIDVTVPVQYLYSAACSWA
ncbi:MAG: glycosyltransferase family 4 protein [Chloroflexi bacterium]|nr:glycosyltransferase family 4 protein [Chloroflexota bacterium]